MTTTRGSVSRSGARLPRGGPFSPLMRRILALNVMALATLVGGVLYLNQFRENLIERRMASLEVQAEIIAGAIGEAATAGPESTGLSASQARQIIARLVGPTENRARLFANNGDLLADSRFMGLGRTVYAMPLPPLGADPPLGERISRQVNVLLDRLDSLPDYPLYREKSRQTASDYPEVMLALDGEPDRQIRRLGDGALLLSVAVPVQRFRRVLSALMLTTDTTDIEEIVRAEQLTILKVFGVALGVTLLMSIFLASTIARPIRRLALAADRVRRGIGRADTLPAFPNRRDEIGALSQAIADMTAALYRQIDAVESFAADVAHELKNPLSSLRSAVESLEKTDKPEIKERLLAIIQEDVKRLDRLITDISDASRLDAELSRGRMETLNLEELVRAMLMVHMAPDDPREIAASGGRPKVVFLGPETGSVNIRGLPSRLSQVVANLVDNALSFSPPDGTVTVSLKRVGDYAELRVEDEGPGLPEGATKNIFQRFYSERPDSEAFGTHSGLGLSISKQIVEAHDGTIQAENRLGTAGSAPTDQSADTAPDDPDAEPARPVIGACFIVRLPLVR